MTRRRMHAQQNTSQRLVSDVNYLTGVYMPHTNHSGQGSPPAVFLKRPSLGLRRRLALKRRLIDPQ